MRRATLILCAAAVDAVAGDPEGWPHPVRLIGWTIARGERLLLQAGDSPRRKLAAGAALTIGVVGASYVGTSILLRRVAAWNRTAGEVLEIAAAASCLAWRGLDAEAGAVLSALEDDDLAQARMRLSRIVGRDTASLNAAGISRAVIETLAESASDGVVAPLLYLALGGVPLAMAFKAVSTMDSMIGHRNARYVYFGRAAARLDDAANLLPSRLTAGAILAPAGARRAQAYATWRRDGNKHASPNAGQPEAAMAGALGVRLGGSSSYAGQPHDAPLLGGEFGLPKAQDARRAQHLVRVVSLTAAFATVSAVLMAQRARRR